MPERNAYRYAEGAALLGVAVAVAALGLAGCNAASRADEAAAQDSAFVKLVNVEVAPIRASDFVGHIRITGEVEALRDVVVSAEESGVIERFYREKGSYLRKGEVLARIDDRLLRSQVKEAESQAALAAERFERYRRLWEEEKIGTEMDFLEAKYQADLEAARLESLRTRLERTRIAAPVSGVFDERYVDEGEMVAPGVPVARIVEVGRVKITGGVPERYAGTVAPGDTARVTLDVLSGRRFPGTLSYVGTAVDPDNRTFPIEVVMDNPDGRVKPHMVADLEIVNQRLPGAIVIPQDAVIRTEDGYQVFVAVERDGAAFAEARTVRLGPSSGDQTVIHEGLREGDRLIVRGHKKVDAGDRLRIVGGA